jgi:hypothetical protein
MRVEIKTKGKTKDPDIKALYILNKGMEQSTERMRLANLQFVLSKWGFKVSK